MHANIGDRILIKGHHTGEPDCDCKTLENATRVTQRLQARKIAACSMNSRVAPPPVDMLIDPAR